MDSDTPPDLGHAEQDTQFGRDLIAALQEALAVKRGDLALGRWHPASAKPPENAGRGR